MIPKRTPPPKKRHFSYKFLDKVVEIDVEVPDIDGKMRVMKCRMPKHPAKGPSFIVYDGDDCVIYTEDDKCKANLIGIDTDISSKTGEEV